MPRSEHKVDSTPNDLFSAWNLKLLETFFSPASSGDEVWLQVDPTELDLIGPELGGDEGFLSCVRNGPEWGTIFENGRLVSGDPGDVVQRVLGLVNQRRSAAWRPASYRDPGDRSPVYHSRNAPAYMPYLAALVRSASSAERGFYPHLRAALQLDTQWDTQQMVSLEEAWRDLAAWTVASRGEFGRFVFRTLGGYSRIGVPLSQSIMRKRDCESIPLVFSQLAVTPGQALTPQLLNDVLTHAADCSSFSKGFREALSKPVFKEPISARLNALCEDWDGTPPRANRQNGNADAAGAVVGGDYVQLYLSLQDGNVFPWNLGWRVPALRDGGEVTIRRAGAAWTATIRGTEAASTANDASSEMQAAARAALADSELAEVGFTATLCEGDEGDQVDLGKVLLRKSILRVFVWSRDSFTGRDELHEHDLPWNGHAFILAAASNSERLSQWLVRESLEHKYMDASGLPDGWVLVCLPDCQALTEAQRNAIPDGENARGQHRVIRLVGGRSVRRAGIKQYMPYDLPVVELDAPAGTVPYARGLILKEEPAGAADLHPSGIRRFEIIPESRGPKSFLIAATYEGQDLGSTTTLRVATDSGEYVESGGQFCLDPKGNPRRDDSGLRGILLTANGSAQIPATTCLAMPLRALGKPVKESGNVDTSAASAAAQFLDTLARLGSMAYGPARDQLARLLARTGSRAIPSTVLLDLRSRGHLEIETNAKGHLARIYAVLPSLYELEATCEGLRVFGVLGTLRTQHWSSLAEHGDDHCAFYVPATRAGFLDTWRLVARGARELQCGFGANRMSVQGNPSLAIAQWAATWEDVRAHIAQNARESLGDGSRGLEKLNSNSGLFFSMENGSFDTRGPACQLFRMEDRDTGKLQVYSLGINQGDNRPRYGFVRDSRWGIWIALGAFADFVKQFGIGDASPWPVPYLRQSGTLLLPARVSVPVVLERALTLCNGSAPELMDLEKRTDPGSPYLAIVRKVDQAAVACTSVVYDEMANGRWLAYKYVPEEIANVVAGKLGGVLVDA